MLKKTAGDTLRHGRWAKDLTIRQLAAKASVSTATIVKLEKGEEFGPTASRAVYRLAAELAIDPADLFDELPPVDSVGIAGGSS